MINWTIKRVWAYLKKKKIVAMALYPYIFYGDKRYMNTGYERYRYLFNHEKIHHAQQIETLYIGFLIMYGTQYLYFRIIGYNHRKAYKSLCFEREAKANEHIEEYYRDRKRYSFIKYIKNNSEG